MIKQVSKILVLTLFVCGCTPKNKIFIPPHYSFIKLTYFSIDEIQCEVEDYDNMNLDSIIIPKYESFNLIYLDRKSKEKWPLKARFNPQSVLSVKPIIYWIGSSKLCAKISIKETYSNNQTLNSRSKKVIRINENNKGTCRSSVINTFESLVEETSISQDQIIREVLMKKGYYVDKDSIGLNNSNPNVEPKQTALFKGTFIEHMQSNSIDSYEGVYVPTDSLNSQYTLGIIKEENIYKIVCLESNIPNWKEGHLKGYFEPQSNPNKISATWYDAYVNEHAATLVFGADGDFSLVLFPDTNLLIRTFTKSTL